MHYLGGKFRVGKQIADFLNNLREPNQPYWEPFVGAAWILMRIKGEPNYASDIHYKLIEMWKELQRGWIPPSEVSEEAYSLAKEGFYSPELTAFIGFGCSWGGKYFGGYARDPKSDRNYAQNAKNSLLKKIAQIPVTRFFQADYFSFISPAEKMLIYCDPPYADTTKYSMTFDHRRFWERCKTLSISGHTVVVSEYQAPQDWNCVLEMPTRTDYKSRNNQMIPRIERLFMHKETK